MATNSSRILVLVFFEEVDGDMILIPYYYAGRWLEEWRKPTVPSRVVNITAPLDEARLSRLRKAARELRGYWELDIFALPTAVREGSDRPYYPTCILAMEGQTGLIVGTELTGPHLTPAERQETVIRVLEQCKQLPREIRVNREEVLQVVEPVARALGASVRVARLAGLEKARQGLFEHFP